MDKETSNEKNLGVHPIVRTTPKVTAVKIEAGGQTGFGTISFSVDIEPSLTDAQLSDLFLIVIIHYDNGSTKHKSSFCDNIREISPPNNGYKYIGDLVFPLCRPISSYALYAFLGNESTLQEYNSGVNWVGDFPHCP